MEVRAGAVSIDISTTTWTLPPPRVWRVYEGSIQSGLMITLQWEKWRTHKNPVLVHEYKSFFSSPHFSSRQEEINRVWKQSRLR